MRVNFSVLLGACILTVGCSNSANPPPVVVSQSAPAIEPKAYDEKTRPTNKEIVRALLQSQNVSLSVDPSCSGVGTDPSDTSIGEYLSGFFAEQSTQKGRNWLEISAAPESPPGSDAVWKCNVVIRHVDGEDRWGWGVSFLLRAKDHKPLEKSFRCTGAG